MSKLHIYGLETKAHPRLPQISRMVSLATLAVNYRSRHRRCSVKKGVLRNFAKCTGKHQCQSLFFNKAAGLGLQLYKKRIPGTGVFL